MEILLKVLSHFAPAVVKPALSCLNGIIDLCSLAGTTSVGIA